MKECKKCYKVKFDWQFYKIINYSPLTMPGFRTWETETWICKSCANKIGERAIDKFINEIDKNIKKVGEQNIKNLNDFVKTLKK